MGEMTTICTFANTIFRNTEAKKLNLLITKINDLYFEGRIPPNYHNTSEIKNTRMRHWCEGGVAIIYQRPYPKVRV